MTGQQVPVCRVAPYDPFLHKHVKFAMKTLSNGSAHKCVCSVLCAAQWRSKALKSGWAQRVWALGDGSTPAGSRGGAPVAPRSQIYTHTICSCQMLFYVGLLPSPSSISIYPSPSKNSSDLRESHDPTRPGQGGHVPNRGYATGVAMTEVFSVHLIILII